MGRPLYSGEIGNNGYANFFVCFFFGGRGGGVKQGALWSVREWWIAFNDFAGEGFNHLITKSNAWQQCWPIRAPHSHKRDFKTKTNDRVASRLAMGLWAFSVQWTNLLKGVVSSSFRKYTYSCLRTLFIYTTDKGDIQSTILPWARLGYEEVNSQWGAEYRTGCNQLISYPTIPMHS